ncbi:hypothetical protein C2U70_09240 [Bradyrhizobium guangdongense]|nr:hypothetical protein C2U70_09240 [Bradyrhizobium guangdongense]
MHPRVEPLMRAQRRNVPTLLAFPLLLVDYYLRIQNSLTELPVRLFIGGLAYLVCIGLAVGLLLPNIGMSVLNNVRRTLRLSWELS